MPGVIEGIVAGLSAIGISATAAGVTSALIGITVQALSMGLGALLKAKPDKASLSGRRDQMQVSVRDPVKARELVIGRIKKGGTIVFIETVNNESDLLMVIAFAGHEVTGIDEVYFFEELAIDQGGEIQAKFRGSVEFEKFLGTADQAASNLLSSNSSRWTPNHRLRGIAYIALKISFNRDLFNQIPNVSAVIRGAKVFDPRDGVTKYSTNAALAFAHYLSPNAFCGLNAAYATDINSTALIAAANECDEDVTIKAGRTLEFGGDDLIDLGNVLNQTGAITIEARVRPELVGIAGQKILDKDDGTNGFALTIEQQKARFLTRGLSNVTLETGALLVAGQWSRIAAVWDPASGAKRIYIDGVEQASATSLTGTLAASSASLQIGASLRGRLQDIRLWAEARSGSEIAQFSDKTLTGQEANLSGYWKLDEKTGERAEDATERPTDGQITGAMWVEDDAVIGTEKRYSANGVVFSDELPRQIIEELLTALAGSSIFTGGEWLVRAAAYESPTVALNEDHLIDTIRMQPRRSKRELFNAVRGKFVAPENQYQPADFPLVTAPGFEAQDGGERIFTDIELPFTTSSSMAQRLAYLHLLRNREQVSVNLPLKLIGLRLRAGDFFEVTNTRFGWSAKDFEALTWQLAETQDEEGNKGLMVSVDGRETNPVIYDFNPATDEIPLNPSPDTTLPSPFGPIALIADFIDRTGFEAIAELAQAGAWPGTISGFVKNPWTGHLNVQDQISATGNNFDVFDNYVQKPVARASYESPEIDIEFSDIVRTFIEATFFKGPGENERILARRYYDVRSDDLDDGVFDEDVFGDAFHQNIGEYGGWKQINKSVKAEGRFFKHKIELDFHSGSGGYLAGFTPVLDKMTLYQKGMGLIVPPGGKSVDFDERYHNLPSMSAAVQNGVRMVDLATITKTGFTALLFDQNADDVGGVMDWQSSGV